MSALNPVNPIEVAEAALADIAAMIGVPAPANWSEIRIRGMATLADAGNTDLSMLASEAYLDEFAATRAAAVIVQRKLKLPPEPHTPILAVDDVDLATAKVLALFAPPIPAPPIGIDPAARVSPTAVIGEGVRIAPFVYVGHHARIGRNAALHPGVYVGDHSTVGDDCRLFANVVVRERITIGSRVIIHAGSMIGSDGFGYRWDGREQVKIPQIGSVVIEDDVEIGSCVCIDRAKFGLTRIGQGTKIDNLVQIAHNVQTGRHCVLAGQVGIAGSSTLGNGVVLAGKTAVRDHVRIGDGVIVAGFSAVPNDIAAGQIVAGIPTIPHRQWLREQAAIRKLPEMVVELRKLREQVERLSAETDKTGSKGDDPLSVSLSVSNVKNQ